MIVVFALVIVFIVYLYLQRTTFGRDIYALGSNAESAQYSGMNVRNVTFAAFILCGITAGIGGLLMTARMNAAEAAMGDAYGLQTVAAVVIGGTSMLGGRRRYHRHGDRRLDTHDHSQHHEPDGHLVLRPVDGRRDRHHHDGSLRLLQ